MKNAFFISVITVIFSLTCYSQVNADSILLRCYAMLSSKKYATYDVTMKIKVFDSEDTTVFRGACLLEKAKDTIFRGLIRFEPSDTLYKFYDGTHIYEVNKNQRRVTQYDPYKGETWAMNGNVSYGMVWDDFLNPERMEGRAERNKSISIAGDTTINKKSCWKIIITFPDEVGTSDHELTLFISKKDYVPILSRRKIKYQGNYQFDEFLLNDYSFDPIPMRKFLPKQIPASYKREIYKQPPPESYTLLDSGAVAPLLFGKVYQNGLKMDTVKLQGQVTLLDFWYMACEPCIKTIPGIEGLYKKYGDKGLRVYGVNMNDNNEKAIARLPKFLAYNTLDYKILLVDESIKDAYKILAWPSIFLIDKSGKVVYAGLGYNEKLEVNLAPVIERLLK